MTQEEKPDMSTEGRLYSLSQERKKWQTALDNGDITQEEFNKFMKGWKIRCEMERVPKKEFILANQHDIQPVDMVEQPPHYANRKYEVIDVMEDTMNTQQFIGYLLGCVFKYLMRWDKKEKPLQDLKKAQWYLNKLIKTIEEEEHVSD